MKGRLMDGVAVMADLGADSGGSRCHGGSHYLNMMTAGINNSLPLPTHAQSTYASRH
jgi:hypothetical protein